MKKGVLRYFLLLAVTLTAIVSTVHPSFANHRVKEDSHTAMVFHALSAIDVALNTGHVDTFNRVFDKLQTNTRFKGSIIYDPEMYSIFTMPGEYEIPDTVQSALDEIAAHANSDSRGGAHTHSATGISEVIEEHISYKCMAIPDYNHEIIGYLVLSYQY